MDEENMLRWYRIQLVFQDQLSPVEIELTSSALFELGAQGVEVHSAHGYLENHPNLFGEIAEPLSPEALAQPTRLMGYIAAEVSPTQVAEVLASYGVDLAYQLLVEPVAEENWQANWMSYYQPEHLSRYLTIVPAWQAADYEPQPREQLIHLDPGVAFGTGNHPTTRLGAQSLETYLRGGETVLDVGTGSGILSLIAGMLGASVVKGYDLDPQAVDSARDNLTLQTNNPDFQSVLEQTDFDFQVNNLLVGIDQTADVIVANILPHILVDMFTDAHRLLNDEGYLILGGILEEKGAQIEAALQEADQWQIIQKNQLGQWLGYVVQKKLD